MLAARSIAEYHRCASTASPGEQRQTVHCIPGPSTDLAMVSTLVSSLLMFDVAQVPSVVALR